MTNLDKDIAMMEKLGYGPHYGNYKVDFPNTMEKDPNEIQESHDYGFCLNCGRRICRKGRQNRKLYCDDFCRQQYTSKMEYIKTQERLKRNG